MRPRVWTTSRKWLGNIVPALVWLPLTAAGVVWIWLSQDMLGGGLILLSIAQAIGWLALNQWGLWDNGRMRRDSMRNLLLRKPPPAGPVVFVGASTARHHSVLDAHEEVGFLSFGPGELEFIGDEKRLCLRREEIVSVRFRPNVHTLLGLGRWVSVEGMLHGRPVRLRVEPRERDTLLGNLALTPWLRDSIVRWMKGQPLEAAPIEVGRLAAPGSEHAVEQKDEAPD